MKNITFFLIFTLSPSLLYSKTIINGRILNNKGESFYYKPFKNFRNLNIESKIEINKVGYFKIILSIDKPFYVKFLSNGAAFSLLVEPNDSLFINLDPGSLLKKENNWIVISGNNQEGQNYYNKIFNYVPFKKFVNIRNLFSSSDIDFENKKVLKEFTNELEFQTSWLRNLLKKEKITPTFYKYAVSDINAILANEAILESEKLANTNINGKNINYHKNISQFQNDIFRLYPPNDKILRSGQYGPIYLYSYYWILSKTQKIDDSKVISKDVPFYSLASIDEQEYLWGENIKVLADLSPNTYNLCELSIKYLTTFPKGPFVEYLYLKNFCDPPKIISSKIEIHEINDTDFFYFLNRFKGRSVLVDFWATWCGPCKMEFKNYTTEFYQFLNTKKVEPVFLSIDDIEDTTKWQNDLRFYNLNGFHAIMNKKMIESIKEIVFENKSISIPRYVLVNKMGKVITWNAPRISDPKLLELIESLE